MSVDASGVWSYRSLINNPDLSVAFDTLRFGAAILQIDISEGGAISGTLGGPGWSLALAGAAVDGTPATLRWQGKGQVDGEEWVYDYLGYVVPMWPEGVNQAETIVGTVIRSVPHSDGQAEAGVTATFYAVRTEKTQPA